MPGILFVDDRPEEVSRFVESLTGRISSKALHPQDLVTDDLKDASLILVDSRLDNWPERDALGHIALQPISGKALAAVLKAHAEKFQGTGLKAFAILTAHLQDYSPGVSAENREHAVARLNNLEWVFQKKTDLQTLTNQFSILAAAVSRLPETWPLTDAEETQEMLRQLLAIKEERSWASRALLDVDGCYPPVRELSEWSHGIELLRWMLHRILPYPCFLWDDARLAARLRITLPSLVRILGTEDELAKMFGESEFTGITSHFLGRRWWRAGIESMLWEMAKENAFDVSALIKLFRGRTQAQIEPTAASDPVVCLDENYRPLDEFCDLRESVRLVVDDWPSYADPPRAPTSLMRAHPEMLAAVLSQDQEKVKDEVEDNNG